MKIIFSESVLSQNFHWTIMENINKVQLLVQAFENGDLEAIQKTIESWSQGPYATQAKNTSSFDANERNLMSKFPAAAGVNNKQRIHILAVEKACDQPRFIGTKNYELGTRTICSCESRNPSGTVEKDLALLIIGESGSFAETPCTSAREGSAKGSTSLRTSKDKNHNMEAINDTVFPETIEMDEFQEISLNDETVDSYDPQDLKTIEDMSYQSEDSDYTDKLGSKKKRRVKSQSESDREISVTTVQKYLDQEIKQCCPRSNVSDNTSQELNMATSSTAIPQPSHGTANCEASGLVCECDVEDSLSPEAHTNHTVLHKQAQNTSAESSKLECNPENDTDSNQEAETGKTNYSRKVILGRFNQSSSRMAGVMDRFKKKKSQQTPEWSRNGSFLNKPEVGWIHPDQQLNPDAGICYGVRYIGNVEVKESMKSLDFDTRTQVAREAINRVAEAAGLKTATKKRKVDKRVARMLGENPHMHYAGANVNLTITTDSINLMVMETGEIIADHPMHVVSFASGGDAETLDFVSYVAKDPALGRACHVLECGGGLAEDVVTTVGQAFELRFKQYLQKQPKTVQLPDRVEKPGFESEKWGEQEDYYNDRPGACPPSPPPEGTAPDIPPVPEYRSPCNVPMGTYMSVKEDGDSEAAVYSEAKEHADNLIDFSDTTRTQVYDNRSDKSPNGTDRREGETSINVYDNRSKSVNGGSIATNGDDSFDPFDMGTMVTTLASDSMRGKCKGQNSMVEETAADGGAEATDGNRGAAVGADAGEIDLRENPSTCPTGGPTAPVFEEWYHGKISRKETEKLLELDGDFLVRESSNSPQQFVLSGKQGGNIRHLLLVDPEGIVRTKDFIFDSVSHLINYHRQNSLPIITQGSELRLVRPIKTCISSI